MKCCVLFRETCINTQHFQEDANDDQEKVDKEGGGVGGRWQT